MWLLEHVIYIAFIYGSNYISVEFQIKFTWNQKGMWAGSGSGGKKKRMDEVEGETMKGRIICYFFTVRCC